MGYLEEGKIRLAYLLTTYMGINIKRMFGLGYEIIG